MKIILASSSPRRRELMKLIRNDFTVLTQDTDETVPSGILPCDAPCFLARKKAEAVAKLNPDDIVIGCDTAVFADDKMLGKPSSVEQAEKMLSALSGREHTVITGCCLVRGKNSHTFSQSTCVRFYSLTKEQIDNYIASGEPFDKAGGYGIQGRGSLLVEGIQGDFFNVVGLPVSLLNRELKQFIDALSNRQR